MYKQQAALRILINSIECQKHLLTVIVLPDIEGWELLHCRCSPALDFQNIDIMKLEETQTSS